MADRPILFSAPMVRALLAGTKTQTRRAVKPQPWILAGELLCWKDDALTPEEMAQRCPHGQPGDRLWVRETWTTHAFLDDTPPRDLTTRSLHYQADGVIKTGKLRPSIHMPRWASRITLEVTGVRVERLQGISEADAQAEGLHYHDGRGIGHSGWREGHGVGFVYDTAREAYADLWRSINGPGSWKANPWVWCVSFKRVTP